MATRRRTLLRQRGVLDRDGQHEQQAEGFTQAKDDDNDSVRESSAGGEVEEWREGEVVWRSNSSSSAMASPHGKDRRQLGGDGKEGRWWWWAVLLPEGYPDSVSADYATYQTWDTVQALCSSVTGLLCTRALLQGVGVGEAGATPGAAAIQWALRDGVGMIGRILFAWMQGSELDNNSKTWRLMADILNDIGMTLELLSPLFPAYFFPLACAGSFCKAIVGVAGGATRAAITMHQARADNMADVAAKDGSQETAVTLVGLLLGLIITPLVEGNYGLIWLLFALFTAAHLFANYRAVRGLVMDTFNRQRLALVVSHYISSSREVLTPRQASDKEWPIWFTFFDTGPRINFGASYSSVVRLLSSSAALHFTRLTSRAPFLVCLRLDRTIHPLPLPSGVDSPDQAQVDAKGAAISDEWGDAEYMISHQPTLEVLIRKDADHEALIHAYATALLVKSTLAQLHADAQQLPTVGRLRASLHNPSLPHFLCSLASHGWDTHRSLLGPGPWRYCPATTITTSATATSPA